MMKPAADPKDILGFLFKQSSFRQITNELYNVPFACSLIVADKRRGLLYLGNVNKLIILKCDTQAGKDCKLEHNLPKQIARLSLSCEGSYLGVTFSRSNAHIYAASSITKNSLELIHEIQLSSFNQNVYAYDLCWNPAVAEMFCTVASDNCIGSFSVKVNEQGPFVGINAMENINGIEAMCVAWSPKGKQLVVGCSNGNVIQLKPDLKIARTIPGPLPSIGKVISILWISNYQFCAAYSDGIEHRINVLIIDAPKGESLASFTYYDDIVFGNPDVDPEWFPRYYFEHVPEWGLIIAASSIGTEIALLGTQDNGATWEQWQLNDSARAQMPLVKTQDTYPVGLTIDKSCEKLLPWGEGSLSHPVPILYIFGTSGHVVGYHMVNLTENSPSLCSPPTEPITIISQPRVSMLPSEISFNLNSNATSTPRPKQDAQVEKPKILPAANLFNEAPKKPLLPTPMPTGASLPQQQTTQSAQQFPQAQLAFAPQTSRAPTSAPQLHQAPALTPQTNPSFSLASQLQQPPTLAPQTNRAPTLAPQIQQTASTPTSPQIDLTNSKPQVEKSSALLPTPRLSPTKEPTTKPQKTVIDDSICLLVFQKEQMLFEKELKAKLKIDFEECGTEEEKQKLVTQAFQVDTFLCELKETTTCLSSEIAYLKGLLLQSFAWLEETKSRNSSNSSDIPRDRYDHNKIKDLQRLFSHTQSQLIQAMKALDAEWIESKSHEKTKIKMPSLEFVYQSLKKQSEIIAKEKSMIEALVKKWKSLARGNNVFSLNRSMSKLNLSKPSSFENSRINGLAGIVDTRCRTIANNTKNFSREKQIMLCDLMLQMKPKVITATHPTPVQDRLEATLSALASSSPVVPSTKSKSFGNLLERTKVPIEQPIVTSQQQPATTMSSIKIPSYSMSPAAVSFQKSTPPSPLVSLNSIVSKIGATPESNPSNQQTGHPVATSFSNSSAFPPVFANSEKTTLPMHFSAKNLSQSSIQPTQTPTSTAFSKALTISFGSTPTETKSEENVGNTFTKDTTTLSKKDAFATKTGISFGAEDTSFGKSLSTNSHTENLFNTSLPAGITISKAKQSTAIQNQASSELKGTATSLVKETTPAASPKTIGTSSSKSKQPSTTLNPASGVLGAASSSPVQDTTPNQKTTDVPFSTTKQPFAAQSQGTSALQAALTSPVKDTTPATSQKTIFSFANAVPTVATTKPAATTTVSSITTSQSFSFSSKPSGNTGSFSFASASPLSTPTFTQQPLELSGLLTGLSEKPVSTSESQPPVTVPDLGKLPMPITSINFGSTPTSSPAASQPTSTTMPTLPAGTSIERVSAASATSSSPSSPSSPPSLFGTPNLSSNIFGGSTAPLPKIFGDAAPAAGGSPFSSPFGTAQTTSKTTENPTTASSSIFGSTVPSTTPSTGFNTTNLMSSLNFGSLPASTVASIFGKNTGTTTTSPSSGSLFGQKIPSTVSSTGVDTVPTTTAPSFFGGGASQNSAPTTGFGAMTVAPATGIFGGNSAPKPSQASSIFGTPGATTQFDFQTNSNIFGGATQKPGSGIFGVGTQKTGGDIFGGAPTFGSPPTMQAPALSTAFGGSPTFGSSPAFGAKPTFGSPGSTFGSSQPEFGGSPFGGSTFGNAPGFGAQPAMGTPSMGGQVFGNSGAGNNTFGALADQNGGLSFGSLAQKSPEKPPAFSSAGGESFTSWRR